MAALEVVFATFELLEAILFDLPIRTLLLSQRVAKQWKCTIERSTKLQQALFFKPIPGDPIPFTQDPTLQTKDSHRREVVDNTNKCLQNPLLMDMFDAFEEVMEQRVVPIEDALIDSLSAGKGVLPSCMRMLPSQPPVCHHIYIECRYQDESSVEHIEDLHYSHEHTMLDIAKGLDAKLEEYEDNLTAEVALEFAPAFPYGNVLENNYQLNDLIRQQKKRRSSGSKDGNLLSRFSRKATKRA